MIKDLKVVADLQILNKIEATGLPCKWKCPDPADEGYLVVSLDEDKPDDFLKFARAVEKCKKITTQCIALNGHDMKDVVEAIKRMEHHHELGMEPHSGSDS